jgi:predicted esterase
MHESHITVARTARYYALGQSVARPREVWFVVHGYGQLAGRFLRHFQPLDDGTRLVVAPEALSRFYLEHPGRSREARIGATWMTREDREAEIADHVAYLDALHDAVFARIERSSVELHVLGFSQGVATIARWLDRGRARADRIVLWGGRMPPELAPLRAESPLRLPRIDFVVGDADEFATPEVVAEQEAWLREQGLPYRLHRYVGGHRIHPPTVAALAG